jgi:tetratricopeptide (TPR) repeat protein
MTSTTLQQALALHQASRLKEAEAGYRQVLVEQPDNPDALHFLGVIAHQSGRPADAIELIRQAIAVRPRPAFWYNLAQAHLVRKDVAAAEEALRHAIAMKPDHAEALFHLGAMHRARDDVAGAIDCYQRALASKPAFVDAHVDLGSLLGAGGDTQKAVEHLRAADRLRPNDSTILNNLGTVLKGVAPLDALQLLQRALALNPQSTEVALNLARHLCSLERQEEAMKVLRDTLALIGDNNKAHLLLASICADHNRTEEAIAHYERAVAVEPNSVPSLVKLGNMYRRVGQFEKAYGYYQRVQCVDPGNCDALVGILRHLKSRVPEEEIARIAEYAASSVMPQQQRRQIHFALSQCREAQGNYDAAFYHMDEGNKLRRAELEAQGGPFDPDLEVRRIDKIIAAFDADYFSRTAACGNTSALPVFVVGMPRSGTTLCEQILASHSRVFGADELPDITRIAAGLRGRFANHSGSAGDEAFAPYLTPEIVRPIAEQHLERLRLLAPGALRIVDKMPLNYRRLGLIATLFPCARIIHCRRDPLDTGLSCYSRDLAFLPIWASDLPAIGHVYRQYERLMAHWRRVLPIEILEFTYETVVADLKGSTRRLIEYCGLEWEDSCLDFHRAERQVKTASIEQVRKPIYDTSIGRWKRFERHLGPLRDALTA